MATRIQSHGGLENASLVPNDIVRLRKPGDQWSKKKLQTIERADVTDQKRVKQGCG